MSSEAGFYEDDDTYHAALRQRVSSLSDDELQQVHDLFDRTNHDKIPPHYWMLGARVRGLIRREQRRRMESTPE
jgi:hypothetical protein